ncbi:hypothetical protein [Sinorhizobium meliloti]|uniref:hypothetical protein n=1 Tax=Rhizobium meliloti TaxID=382 RepID=UPI0003688E9A|nr:hypothetical protein [Sinorhizobium meliloti]PND20631.1 hypothetical protein CN934_16435 [Ensifer sp. MMN_5]RVQ00866.1 hypothetical protein CN070_13570 [Sinorhizobium meliloti]
MRHQKFGRASRVLAPGELIPPEVVAFIGAQIGLQADDLVDLYCSRIPTPPAHDPRLIDELAKGKAMENILRK